MIIAIIIWPGLAEAFKPAVIFDTWRLKDGGYIESAYHGLLAFEKYKNTPVLIITPDQGDVDIEATYLEWLAAAADKGRDPIVTVGFSFERAVREVAWLHPDTHFITIDALVSGQNVQSIVFREEEGAFLMGYLAAMATQGQKVGFVGGMDGEMIRKFACAYAQGAKYRNPDVQVLAVMTGTTPQAFNDPERGARLAQELIAQGVDVIFHAAGATGDGVIRAAAAADIRAIGVDSDQNHLAPRHMLTSMLKRMDVAIFLALSQAVEGPWKPGVLRLGFQEGGVDWALDEHNVMLMTEEMQAKMDELAFDMLAGLLKVIDYTNLKACPYLDFGPSPREPAGGGEP
jgi:basic membrane protein A